MSLKFHPRLGMVLMCDFNIGFKVPEMVKQRPVVVISPPPRRFTQLCTIVPLSATVPNQVEPFHHRMNPNSLPGWLAEKECWAKCDMLYTLSLARFRRIILGKDPGGKRIYANKTVTEDDLEAIRRGVMVALGMVEAT